MYFRETREQVPPERDSVFAVGIYSLCEAFSKATVWALIAPKKCTDFT